MGHSQKIKMGRFNRGKRLAHGLKRRRGPGYSRMSSRKAAYRGSKALRILRSTYRPEKKVHDVNPVATSVFNTGTVIGLTRIAQGDGRNERDGRAALHASTWAKCLVEANPNATQSSVRMILFTDTQQIADTPPTTAQLLATHAVGTETICGRTMMAAPGRFKVFADKTINLHPNGVRSKVVTLSTKKRFNMRWNAGLAGDTQKNMLYLCYIGTESANNPTMNLFSRTRFYDS